MPAAGGKNFGLFILNPCAREQKKGTLHAHTASLIVVFLAVAVHFMFFGESMAQVLLEEHAPQAQMPLPAWGCERLVQRTGFAPTKYCLLLLWRDCDDHAASAQRCKLSRSSGRAHATAAAGISME